jgi:hypothetical protein
MSRLVRAGTAGTAAYSSSVVGFLHLDFLVDEFAFADALAAERLPNPSRRAPRSDRYRRVADHIDYRGVASPRRSP